MNQKGLFANMVKCNWGNFDEHVADITSEIELFKKCGWGWGFSGRHFFKMLSRDETIFTTTWAELRQTYFQMLLIHHFPSFGNLRVPLPCHADGKVLTDKEIADKVKLGYRLMFYPATKARDFNGSSLISLGSISVLRDVENQRYEDSWLAEIGMNSRPIEKPYWYWIDCTGGFWSKATELKSPTLPEYLIAARVFYDEFGASLDDGTYTWIRHHYHNPKKVILGNQPPIKIDKGYFIGVGDWYVPGEEITDFPTVKFPIRIRATEIMGSET
jgi:hypothetical protein